MTRRTEGLTLIELMVAMAVVGLIFAVAAVGLRSVFNVNLKKESTRLASTLRYLSNKAVTDHLHLRMVYDLEQNSYHVEESADPFVVSPQEEEGEEGKEEKAADAVQDKDQNKESPFTTVESKLLSPQTLASGVHFKDVFVSYLQKKKEQGQAYTYFFPDGYATPTLINLRDDDDEEHFSIEVMAFSGRVKTASEYRESLTEEKK